MKSFTNKGHRRTDTTLGAKSAQEKIAYLKGNKHVTQTY